MWIPSQRHQPCGAIAGNKHRREYRTQRWCSCFQTQHQYKALKGLSEASGIGLNQLIISIIEEHLDKHKV